jgi:hypothetical protein
MHELMRNAAVSQRDGPSFNLAFGMRCHSPSMASNLSGLVDRMELLVKR